VRGHLRIIQTVGAVVLIALGVALVTGLWGEAMASLQGWVSGFEVAL
jgi:cytochrome c-type biogenesis protein